MLSCIINVPNSEYRRATNDLPFENLDWNLELLKFIDSLSEIAGETGDLNLKAESSILRHAFLKAAMEITLSTSVLELVY